MTLLVTTNFIKVLSYTKFNADKMFGIIMLDGEMQEVVYDFETGNIGAVMDGDLDGFINAYLKSNSKDEKK